MPTTIKGQSKCPECGSIQPVKYDGRKYFINCAECRTMTTYQSKAAQQRLLNKLAPGKEETPAPETEPEPTNKPKTYKPSHAPDGLLGILDEIFE